jgi:hypothetical protein
MKSEGSLPHSQLPATCLYPEPAQSSPSNVMSLFRCLGRTKVSVQVRGFVSKYFVTKIRFYSKELLAPRPTPKLEDQPLSTVRDCLFNIFAATLHIGGRSCIRNPRTRPAVVTGTHLQHGYLPLTLDFVHLNLESREISLANILHISSSKMTCMTCPLTVFSQMS